MGLIIRQGFKSSIGYYLGILIGIVNTLFFSTKFLSPNELGITRLLFENSMFFATIAHFGVPQICDRYFSHIEKNESQRDGFLVFLIMISTMGILCFTLGFVFLKTSFNSYFSEKSSDVLPFLWLCIPITICWVYIYILESYSRVNHRTAVPTMLRESVFKVLNLIVVFGYGLKLYDFQTFLYYYIFSMYLILISLVFYIHKIKPIKIIIIRSLWKKDFLKNIYTYGIIAILGAVGATIIIFIDRNIIANKLGTSAVAIFTIAALISGIVEIPSKALRGIAGPFIAKAIYNKDNLLLKDLYQKSALNMMILGGVMLALILICVEDLLLIMPKSDIYGQAGIIIFVLGIAKWLDISLGLNAELITYSKYYPVNTSIIVFFTFIAIVLNVILIEKYGILGSAIATALTTLFISIFRLIFVYYKFQLFPFDAKSFLAALLILFFGIAVYFIPSINSLNWVTFIITTTYKSTVYLSTILIAFLYFDISNELNNLVRNIKTKIGY